MWYVRWYESTRISMYHIICLFLALSISILLFLASLVAYCARPPKRFGVAWLSYSLIKFILRGYDDENCCVFSCAHKWKEYNQFVIIIFVFSLIHPNSLRKCSFFNSWWNFFEFIDSQQRKNYIRVIYLQILFSDWNALKEVKTV